MGRACADGVGWGRANVTGGVLRACTWPGISSLSGSSSWYTPGVSTTCSPAASLALITPALSAGVVTYTSSNPTAVPQATKSAPCEEVLTGGSCSQYLPAPSIVMKGFSAIVGVESTVVIVAVACAADPEERPQWEGGAPTTPEKTMFHTPPFHAPTVESRENHLQQRSSSATKA